MKFLYCIKGNDYWEMSVLSVLSLLNKSKKAEVIIIRDHSEYNDVLLNCFKDRVRYIEIDGSDPRFPKISYRSNCFKILIDRYPNLFKKSESIIITDADVLWLENPDRTFSFLRNYETWGQIVTPLNFLEYRPVIPPFMQNIGARTLYDAHKRNIKFSENARFRLNAGLYKISWRSFSKIIPKFVNAMTKIPVKKIWLSESILSNFLAEECGSIAAFEQDVVAKLRVPFLKKFVLNYDQYKNSMMYKHLYEKGSGTKIDIIKDYGNIKTGREIARHYMSGQKEEFFRDARSMLKR